MTKPFDAADAVWTTRFEHPLGVILEDERVLHPNAPDHDIDGIKTCDVCRAFGLSTEPTPEGGTP